MNTNHNESVVSQSSQGAVQGQVPANFVYKSRVAASALAFFVGVFGAHRFFLGKWWGIFYLLFFWTYIPWIIAVIEGIVFLTTSQEEWNRKYNSGVSIGQENGTVVGIFAIIPILIAFFGVFAAISIPAYQDYTIRAKVGEAMVVSGDARQRIAEYVAENGSYPESESDIGLEYTSDLVSKLRVENGTIYMEMSPQSNVEGMLIFKPESSDSGIEWDCTVSTIPRNHLPSQCRTQD